MRNWNGRGISKWIFASLMTVGFGSAGQAWAVPDLEGGESFVDPNGSYTVDKTFKVYSYTNPENPAPVAGNNTYIYTLTNQAASFIGIEGFDLEAPPGSITAAGFIDGTGVEPSATMIGTVAGTDVVEWDFLTDVLDPGETSEELTVHSPYGPGSTGDNMVSVDGQFALTTPGTCVGPTTPPVQPCDLEIEKEGCVIQPPSPPGDACEGKVRCFSFEYTGLGCDASSNLQDPKKTLCLGDAGGTGPVDILVSGRKHKKGKKSWWGWWKKRKSKKNFAHHTDVQVGDIIEVCSGHGGKRNFGAKTTIKIKGSNGGHHKMRELNKFHTSCSQPFGPGNQFGSVKITSVTSTKGGTVDLEEDPPSEECVTEVDVTEPPHCVGKVTSLTLRYVGGDCNGTMNGQGTEKQLCVDAMAAGSNPVRVIVSDGAAAPPSTTVYRDSSPLGIGDLITINASDAGHSALKPVTGYWIKDAATGQLVSDGYFHTSCSKPVNLGDQFGSLQVYSITSTGGGTASLEHEVEYTYTVTNPNGDTATNISVDDDLLGNITSGQSILAGESAVYTTTALISEETTNVGTVTGEVNSVSCDPATSTATITVVEPPPPGSVCTKKIAAIRMRYSGPDILGAMVEFEANRFRSQRVTYGPINLIGGVTELSAPVENGYSIDATTHDNTDVGLKLKIFINGVVEVLHTSCSVPVEMGKPAPLNEPEGGPSPNWTVVDFTEKD